MIAEKLEEQLQAPLGNSLEHLIFGHALLYISCRFCTSELFHAAVLLLLLFLLLGMPFHWLPLPPCSEFTIDSISAAKASGLP